MSECCEMYPDFIAICSFLDIFGAHLSREKENLVPKPYNIKQWMEMDLEGRGLRARMNTLYEFLLGLLSSFSVRKEKCKNIGDVDDFLIAFTASQDMTETSSRLSNWGFQNISIKDKLAIIRRLLEYQLDQNKLVLKHLSYAKGPDIRHEPLGRDCLGNYYWMFGKGRHSYIVKELVDPKSQPFCGFVQTQNAAHDLIHHIKQCKVSDLKSIRKTKNGLKGSDVLCGMCKKAFDGSNVRDTALHFDNTDWFCPNCEQTQLISTVTDLFLSEE